jgi:hypothetical protein
MTDNKNDEVDLEFLDAIDDAVSAFDESILGNKSLGKTDTLGVGIAAMLTIVTRSAEALQEASGNSDIDVFFHLLQLITESITHGLSGDENYVDANPDNIFSGTWFDTFGEA